MSYTFTLLTSQLSAEGDNGCVGIRLGANEDGVAYIPHEYANVNGTRDVRISALGLTKYDTCKFVISYTRNGVGNLRIKIKKSRRKASIFLFAVVLVGELYIGEISRPYTDEILLPHHLPIILLVIDISVANIINSHPCGCFIARATD